MLVVRKELGTKTEKFIKVGVIVLFSYILFTYVNTQTIETDTTDNIMEQIVLDKEKEFIGDRYTLSELLMEIEMETGVNTYKTQSFDKVKKVVKDNYDEHNPLYEQIIKK